MNQLHYTAPSQVFQVEPPFVGYDKQQIISSRGQILTTEQRRAIGARNKEMARLKKELGWSWGKIARTYNLSRTYVKSICHKLGVYGKTRRTSFSI